MTRLDARLKCTRLGHMVAAVAATTALSSMALAQDAMDEARVAHQKQIDQLEQRMPLGPHRAQKLGMKIQWQFESPHPIVHFFPADDSVYLINHHNELSRVDGQKGTLRWHTHGGTRADQIIDVIALNDLDRILVLRSTSILTVAKSTGNPASIGEARGSRQPLEWLAATPGVVNGPFLIYGGLGGELSWQGYTHGFTEAAHRIGRRIETTPVLVGNLVIAASHSGDVYGLDANTRRARWMTPLLGKPVGPVALLDKLLYVASDDQHLRAINTNTGIVEWARLLEAPLNHGPFAVGDKIYQQVPQRGLVCMEARPQHAPEGKEAWTATDVTGNVIASDGGMLITWDPAQRRMQSVSAATGAVEFTAHIPEATGVIAKGDSIYIRGRTSQLQSLQFRSSN